jgi:hypothetical protein
VSAAHSAGEALLVVVSPAALALDGESVRVARDVLGAAFAMKAVVPGDLAELERVLSRRGRRRLVVIGDDHALHQVVQLLHRHCELEAGPVGVIPVGKGPKVALARSLGAASRPVEAARAIARGTERSLDLLVDEDGGVVLGGLRIPGRGVAEQPVGPGTVGRAVRGGAGPVPEAPAPVREHGTDPHAACSPRANGAASGRGHGSLIGSWCSQLSRTAWTAARSMAGPLLAHTGTSGQFLRIEADGRLLADRDHPVGLISVWNATAQDAPTAGRGLRRGPGGPGSAGLMEVLVSSPGVLGGPYRCQAQRISVTGGLFTYEADHALSGPVRERTWTVAPGAWRLTVPAAVPPAA